MEFTLSSEQTMLKDSVRRYALEHFGFAGRAKRRDMAAAQWRGLCDMGWVAAGFAPERGGFGGAIEISLIAQELGRVLAIEPYLGLGVLAPQLLLAAGDATNIEDDALLAAICTGDRRAAAAVSELEGQGDLAWVGTHAAAGPGGFILSGEKSLVLGGDQADIFIVSARINDDEIGLFLVQRGTPGAVVIPTMLADGSPACALILKAATGSRLDQSGRAPAALRQMAEFGIAAIAAEALGMIERVLEITIAFAKTRKQFDVPIASFQVIQHKIADMVVDYEYTMANRNVALAAFEITDPVARERRFSGVKYAVGEALRRVTEHALQIHGAMGMAEENEVGHFLKRMVVLDAVLGAPSYHLTQSRKGLQAQLSIKV